MPPILAPLPRRLSTKYSPLVCPSDLLPAVKHSKPRGVPLRVDVNYVKPAVLLDPPSIILNVDNAMEHSTPIDELMDILAKPASAVDNAYRPGAPAPESIPMTYTSSSSSISTYSTTSPLSFSPLDTTPDYRVERKKRSPQRKGRGASLEPQISPYARPVPPKRLASFHHPPSRRRSYTNLQPAVSAQCVLEPLFESNRGRSRSTCTTPNPSNELVNTLDGLRIRD